MGKFSMAEALKTAGVFKSDAGREVIEYISLSMIDSDENNFYELSGLDSLAANIELVGLQQPIRVRTSETDPSRVVIVSGHRRCAAMRKLVEDGNDKFSTVACIREQPGGSAALQQLRLIYANADTRHLSSAEIGRQAEEVRSLLYQLKEEGYEFPGRMIDHVAEACQVSKSKLARLKVIREHLSADWMPHFESGNLAESTAYTLARMPEQHQSAMYAAETKRNADLKYVYDGPVSRYAKKMAKADRMCGKDGDAHCSNLSRKLERICSRRDDYMYTTPCSECCAKCEYLVTCGYSCDKCAEDKAQRKAEVKADKAKAAQAEAERKAKEAEDKAKRVATLSGMWANFDKAAAAKGLTAEDVARAILDHWEVASFCASHSRSEASITPAGISVWELRRVFGIADMLGCSVDYLLGREAAKAEAWRDGHTEVPDKPCEAVIDIDLGFDWPSRKLARWSGESWVVFGTVINFPVVRWLPLPEV